MLVAGIRNYRHKFPRTLGNNKRENCQLYRLSSTTAINFRNHIYIYFVKDCVLYLRTYYFAKDGFNKYISIHIYVYTVVVIIIVIMYTMTMC